MPFFNRLTRITYYSATLIDNIFVNNPSIMQQLISGILFSDISDHLPIFTIQPNKPLMSTDNVNVVRRDINPRTLSIFQLELKNCKWIDIYQYNDPNAAYNNFLDKYSAIYNSKFPLKEISRKKAKLISKPWITIASAADVFCVPTTPSAHLSPLLCSTNQNEALKYVELIIYAGVWAIENQNGGHC